MATCNSMCPVSEIEFRNKNGLVHFLEATKSSRCGPRNKYVADLQKMVKEYSRSAADTHKFNKPELLRPLEVLIHTVDYLLELYAPFKDRRQDVSTKEFSTVFSFVSDRLRSVRQDMIMQNMRGNDSVLLMEKMLPFYIETDSICKIGKCSSYNSKLHDFQLEECFGRWFESLFECEEITPGSLISASFFFRQLHRNPAILHELFLFREKLSENAFIMIKNVVSSFSSNNYCRFFCIFKSLDPLLKHSLCDSVFHLRQSAIRTISTAFKTPVAKLPSQSMSEWLGFPANLEFFDAFLRLYHAVPDEKGNVLVSTIKLVEIPFDDVSSRQY